MENKIAGFYTVKELIAKGSTGSIFSVTHCKTGKKFAAKVENDSISKLQYESRLYKLFKGSEGFIQTYSFSNELNKNILIFDLLGHSLQHYFELNNKHLSILSALIMVDQVITRLEVIHSKNFVHRDLRPEHLLTGLSTNSEKVFLIDLTSMKLFRNSKSGLHLKQRKAKNSSVSLFSSAWVSLGYECSRRDDLESLWFVFLYLIKGSLPWEVNRNSNQDKKNLDFDMKINSFNTQILEDLPPDIMNIFSYTRNMKFDSKPDYSYLRSKIRLCLKALGADPLIKITEVLLFENKGLNDYAILDHIGNENNRKERLSEEKSLQDDGKFVENSIKSISGILENQSENEASNFQMENTELMSGRNDKKIIVSRCPSSSQSKSSSISNDLLTLDIRFSSAFSGSSKSSSCNFHLPIEKSTEL